MIFKIFLFCLLFLQGCSFKSKLPLTKSPCIDGIIVNIKNSGCIMLYAGIDPKYDALKIRCTLSRNQNWWTSISFYSIDKAKNHTNSAWVFFCKDQKTKVLIAPSFYR